MDELLFRTSQRFEALQVQLSVAAQQSKAAFQYYSEVGRDFAVQTFNSPNGTRIKESARELWIFFIHCMSNIEQQVIALLITPREVYDNIKRTLSGQWTRQNLYFGCCGFVLGALLGFCIGLSMHKNVKPLPLIKAAVCNKYGDLDEICYIDDAQMPTIKFSDEIIIQVKTATIQQIDIDICNGYGRNIRRCLNQYFHTVKNEFPIVLGRECAGIVTEIGSQVNKFEIGDEVWFAAPFWSPGTLSEYIVTKERNVGRKPTNISFEGATSIPYSGTIAINSLKKANLNEQSTQGKRIFLYGSCTPVGCILTQILKLWGAHLTTTSSIRAAPVALAMGSLDNIVLTNELDGCNAIENNSTFTKQDLELARDNINNPLNRLLKELKCRDSFDIIFVTEPCEFDISNLKKFLKEENSPIINTLHKKLLSDSFGFFFKSLFAIWIYSECYVQKMFTGQIRNFGEPNTNYEVLDKLANLIENGQVQSVVDHVYPLHQIDSAILHRQSSESIGSTVIKFN